MLSPKKKLVVLSGAGISAESGISTFRDSDGLWENYRIEEVATPEAWHKNKQLVNRFYNMRRKRIMEANPNKAHLDLAALEEDYEVVILTQNIDNLHERAGSSHVVHLHGEIFKMRCEKKESDIQEIFSDINESHISKEGFQMRPHIVWFGESVPMMDVCIQHAKQADVFLIIGTSLNVYPAAGLYQYVNNNCPIYIIDKNIPINTDNKRIIPLQMRATDGVSVFAQLLKNQ